LPAYDFQARALRIRPNTELMRSLRETIGNDAVKVEIHIPGNGRAARQRAA
jgi:hypothetical protein